MCPLIEIHQILVHFSYESFLNSTTILLQPGATKDLVDDKVDLVINSRPFTPSFVIEYLYPHYFNPVSIFLPKAEMISGSIYLLQPFKWNSKIALFWTILTAILVNVMLYRTYSAPSTPRSRCPSPTLEIIAYMLLVSFTSTAAHPHPHRLFLTTWSFFAVIIMTIVTGNIYSNLVVVRYDEDVNSVDELLRRTPYRVPITSQRYSLFEIYRQEGKLSEQYWRLLPRFTIVESRQDIFRMVSQNQKYAYMLTNGHCEYIVSEKQFASEDGGPLYHLMKEVIGESTRQEGRGSNFPEC